jgi:uncharacterized protein YndB with AHSA1/START domain
MGKSSFVYEIYIAATEDEVWRALLEGDFTRQYWAHENVSDWQPGSLWEHRQAKDTRAVRILGEVIASQPPHRLVITWAEPKDRAHRERHSRVTFDIKRIGGMTRLTITHDELDAGSTMDQRIRAGWPRVLSSLKSLLETGRALDTWAHESER